MNASSELAARDRRRNVRAIAPIVGLLAVGLLAWQSSYAAFSATTDNKTESWYTGNMALTNDGGVSGAYSGSTLAVFAGTSGGTNTESTLKPGSTNTKCITVKSSSTSDGKLAMYESAFTDSTPAGLASQIKLTIDAAPVATEVTSACAGFPATGLTSVAANVPVATMPNSYANTTAATQVSLTGSATANLVAYRITYTFVSTGGNPGDNALMNKSATANFVWELQ